jgi:hypothetical protein
MNLLTQLLYGKKGKDFPGIEDVKGTVSPD